MSDYTRVYFEGLGIDFDVPSVAFTIGSYSIHWYGIIIAFGFALAVLYGGRMAYKWKMSLDGMTDVLMWGTIFRNSSNLERRHSNIRRYYRRIYRRNYRL